MTIRTEGLEYNILGSIVRIKADESQSSESALKAVEILQKEIQSVQLSNSKLRDIDVAVLAALKLASDRAGVESEYKDSVMSLKAGVADALSFIEEVSPGPMRS